MAATDPHPARSRLVLVLDVDTWEQAAKLVTRLRPWFQTAKVGAELYAAAGPDVISRLHDLEMRVFADLKLHDIPTTVERAARVLARRGVDLLNFHAAGGVDMLRAGVRGLHEGASTHGTDGVTALAVTVLTSHADATKVPRRLDAARDSGCDGVVCAAFEVDAARERGLRTMVPGVRFEGEEHHDQERVTTPVEAVERGADWLVVGRAVTGTTDPEAAARRLADEVAGTWR